MLPPPSHPPAPLPDVTPACVFGSSEPMSPLSRARSRTPPAWPSLLPLTQRSCTHVGRLPHCASTSVSAAMLNAEPSRPNFPVLQSPCRRNRPLRFRRSEATAVQLTPPSAPRCIQTHNRPHLAVCTAAQCLNLGLLCHWVLKTGRVCAVGKPCIRCISWQFLAPLAFTPAANRPAHLGRSFTAA